MRDISQDVNEGTTFNLIINEENETKPVQIPIPKDNEETQIPISNQISKELSKEISKDYDCCRAIGYCCTSIIILYLAIVIVFQLLPFGTHLINQYNQQINCINNSNDKDCITFFTLQSASVDNNYDYNDCVSCPPNYFCASVENDTLSDEKKSCSSNGDPHGDICKRYQGTGYYETCCSKWYPYEYNKIYYSNYCVSDMINQTQTSEIINDCHDIYLNPLFIDVRATTWTNICLLISSFATILIFVIKYFKSNTMSSLGVISCNTSLTLSIILIFLMLSWNVLNYHQIVGTVNNILKYNKQCYYLANYELFETLLNYYIALLVVSSVAFVFTCSAIIIFICCCFMVSASLLRKF